MCPLAGDFLRLPAFPDPFSWLPARQHPRGILFLLSLAALAFLAVATTNLPLQTETAPLGILSLQFAGSPARAGAVVASWGNEARVYAGLNIGLDYLFLVAYSLLLALACSFLAGRRAMLDPRWVGLGRVLSWGMLLAGLLDGVENWASLSLLLEPGRTGLGPWITAFSSAKFVLILLGVYYIAVGTIALALRKRAG